MGEANRRKRKRDAILQDSSRCIYCGAVADTIDHCPPRSFFIGRHAPAGYEFPCCSNCNDGARLDEQALSVIFRIRITEPTPCERQELEKAATGIRNNQPALLDEWGNITASAKKRSLRQTFGYEKGDELRHAGWGVITAGPLTKKIVDRFIIKLGKALYYYHVRELFDGIIYSNRLVYARSKEFQYQIDQISRWAPELAKLERNAKSLSDQFIYRYNCSVDLGVLHAIVQFGDQTFFQIIAVRHDTAAKLESDQPGGADFPGRYVCRITPPSCTDSGIAP